MAKVSKRRKEKSAGKKLENYRGPKLGDKPAHGWFDGNPVKGSGYGRFGDLKHKDQVSIDSHDRGARLNTPGKGTATRRGDRFLSKSGFSFGRL